MEIGTELTTQVTLRPSDVFDPFLYSWRNVIRWSIVLFACLFIYDTHLSLFALRSGVEISEKLLNPLLIALVVFGIFVVPWLRLQWTFRKYPRMREVRSYTFGGEGMHIESQQFRGDYKWQLFERIVETRSSFVFAITSRSATYVPKRCLAGQHEIAILRQLIRDNFKGKKTLRPD